LVFSLAAAADQLVTRGGQIIETRGSWEALGGLLVFELADGSLASLRLEDVDLEASRRRTREAAQRATQVQDEAPPEPAQATVVITDRDVVRARDLGASRATQEDGGTPVARSGTDVQVVEWSEEPEGETGLALRGVIQNLGSGFATGVEGTALFYDESGALVASRDVQFQNGPLAPAARRDFSVSLPDTLIYEEVKVLVVGRGFRSVGPTVRTGSQQSIPDESGGPETRRQGG
jgi:hypothetical protein